ncbi:MAG: NDP-sugar synthase [Thermoproteus sp.]
MMERVIVLAGGFATRLRPLSYTRPKPLFPVLDKPIIDWIVEGVRGIAPVVVSARYLSHMIRDYVSRRWSDAAAVIEENRPLGDGGAVAYIADMLSLDGPVLVVNGDVFTDIDYSAVIKAHEKHGGVATIAFVEVPPENVSKYGIAIVDDSMRLRGFVEKPKEPPGGSRLANAGVYVFEAEALKAIPRRRGEVKIAKDLIPALLEKQDIYVYIHRGIWHDIGTPADYLKANFAALDKWGGAAEKAGAEITPPVYIAEGVEIGEGASIGPYVVLGSGARVGKYSRVRNSVLMRGVAVEPGSHISGSIIGEESYIGRWVRVVDAVIADGVYVRDEVSVGRNSSVGPNREVVEDVPEGATLP